MSGGKIFIKAGTYLLTSDIAISSGIWLQGDGMFSTILKNARTTAQGYTGGLLKNKNIGGEATPRDTDIIISDLTLDGDRQNGRYGFGIAMEDVDRIIIQNVYLKNWDADAINFNGLSTNQGGRGQAVGTATKVVIKNVLGYSQGVDLLALNNVSDFVIDTVISDAHGQRTDVNGHGLTIVKDTYDGVINNVVAKNGGVGTGGVIGGAGIAFFGGWNIDVSNIVCENNQGCGIYLENAAGQAEGPHNINFVNVVLKNNLRYGLYAKNFDRWSLTNAKIMNSGYGSGTTYDAIYLETGCQDVTITDLIAWDNQATKTQNYAVRSAGTCDRVTIIGGNVLGNIQTAPISLAGTGNIIKNVKGYDTENFKSTGVSVAVGTGGAYGSASAITSRSGVITYPRVKITWGGTFGTGETVTVRVEAVYRDGSTAYVEKSATATGSLWLTDDDILALITLGKDIVKLNVYAKSSATSTTVTVTVDAYGKA
jgi:hypothetical protein